jgi:hypothetical protein
MPVWGDGTYFSSALPRCSLQVSPAPGPLKTSPGRESARSTAGGGVMGRRMHTLVLSTTSSYSCGKEHRFLEEIFLRMPNILPDASEICPKCLMAAATQASPLPHAHRGFFCT